LIILNRREVSAEELSQIGHHHRVGVPGKDSESVAIIWAPRPDEDHAVAPTLNGVWLFGKGKRELDYDRDPNIEPICFTSLFPRGTQGYALKRYPLNLNPVKRFTNESTESEAMDDVEGAGSLDDENPVEESESMECRDDWSSDNSDSDESIPEFSEDVPVGDRGIFPKKYLSLFQLFLIKTPKR